MTIHLVTFASDDFMRSAFKCLESARANGVHSTSVVVDTGLHLSSIYHENKELFDAPRGYGYWAWKPWIIYETMMDIESDDYLIYADAGIEFINNVSHIIDRMDQDIFLFGNNWEHAHWCKKDVVERIYWGSLTVPPPWGWFGKQAQASVIFFRISDYSRRFVKEWLDWCLFEGGRLIDDSPSRTPNHPEFREHRHDQAILTTMAYRDGIKLHYWPAVYNDGAFTYEKLPEYSGDDYPILFHHHRRRNHEWEVVA